MVPELRKRHRWIWLLLLVILPVGVVITLRNLPESAIQLTPFPDKHTQLPMVVGSMMDEHLKVYLRMSEEGNHELEVMLYRPIPVPAAQVFWQGKFLGDIGPRGEMWFKLDSAQLANPPYTFEIRNAIDNSTYAQLSLQP